MSSPDIACRPRAIQPAVIMTWLAIGVAAGCTRIAAPPAEVNEAAPVVYVVNYPLQYFAERVGGDAVDVRFPAPRDGDPAFWKPDTDAIVEYQSADLILLNGATYAKWIPRASLPTSRMVDTSASFGERLIDIEADTTHRHGPAGEHAHGGTAFTTWLDFDQAIAQAQAVHDALARRRPANADAFGANLEALTNDLRKLDEQLMSIAREIDGEPLVASHPVYQYWARRYGFNLQSVTLEPDVVPDDRAMGVLKTILADHPAKIMIWEGDPDPRSVELLRTIGVRSVVFDPCGNIPDEGDFLTAMKRNTEALREVLAAISAASDEVLSDTRFRFDMLKPKTVPSANSCATSEKLASPPGGTSTWSAPPTDALWSTGPRRAKSGSLIDAGSAVGASLDATAAAGESLRPVGASSVQPTANAVSRKSAAGILKVRILSLQWGGTVEFG